MKFSVTKKSHSGQGLLDVTVHMDREGRNGRNVRTTIEVPRIYVRNEAGWYQDAAGNWHSPYQLVDGEWIHRLDPDVEWATREITDDEIIGMVRPQLRDLYHKEFVDRCVVDGFGEYTDDEFQVRIVPQSPVHLDDRTDTGMVQVQIAAYDSETDEPLWIGDGFWAFDFPPTMLEDGEDPAGRLRKELARRVREMQSSS